MQDRETIHECPVCDTEVNTGDPWEWGSGECSTCGNEFFWDEISTDDDYWPDLVWVGGLGSIPSRPNRRLKW